MKIGIITYNNAMNFGAALQSYALCEYLNEAGYDANIIDYESNYLRKTHKADSRKIFMKAVKSIIFGIAKPMINLKKSKFKKFYKNFYKTTDPFNRSNINKTNKLFDSILIGSDQVWNYNINGADMTYLGDFVDEGMPLYSYASSFGLTDVEEKYKNEYSYYLNQFLKIGVREQVGQKIVYELTGKEAVINVDPVFLLTADRWKQIFALRDAEKHLLIYCFEKDNRKICYHYLKSLRTRKRILEFNVGLSIEDMLNPRIKLSYVSGPVEFLKGIAESEFICTDSFHCVAFCILFRKRFVVLLKKGSGANTRITQLLSMCDLLDRIGNENSFSTIYNKDIDWKFTHQKLNTYIQNSREFLLNILDENEN